MRADCPICHKDCAVKKDGTLRAHGYGRFDHFGTQGWCEGSWTEPVMTDYPDYPTRLGDVDFGVPFEMLNRDGLHIRIKSSTDFDTVVEGRYKNPLPFNDDGSHVPIVELKTGGMFHMSKVKPCRIRDEWK